MVGNNLDTPYSHHIPTVYARVKKVLVYRRAEREGFEPSIPFIEVYSLSRRCTDRYNASASVSV